MHAVTGDLTSKVHDLAIVTVHTWTHSTHAPHVTTTPKESWLDAAHGPVLEGVLLSTPALLVLLLTLVVTALVMAARAAGAEAHTSAGRH